MTSKFNKNKETIDTVLITRNSESTEAELIKVSALLNNEASSEYSIYRKEYFTRDSFLEQLIILAKEHENNDVILRNLISAMGFICSKYSYYNQDVFDFLIKNIDNHSNIVKIAIAKNIYKFPQFINWTDCWSYTLTIPRIAPKKESLEYFSRIIDKYSDSLPMNYILEIKNIFHTSLNNNNIGSNKKNYYLEIINKIEE